MENLNMLAPFRAVLSKKLLFMQSQITRGIQVNERKPEGDWRDIRIKQNGQANFVLVHHIKSRKNTIKFIGEL